MAAGEPRTVIVSFTQHLAEATVESLTSQLAQYGLVAEGHGSRQITILVARPAKLNRLKTQLTAWEREGYLSWADETNFDVH